MGTESGEGGSGGVCHRSGPHSADLALDTNLDQYHRGNQRGEFVAAGAAEFLGAGDCKRTGVAELMGSGERNHALPSLDHPWLYCISNGSGWEGLEPLVAVARAGVDFIQVREKQLSGRELLAFCRKLRAAVPPGRARLLVNGRLDVALAAGFDGVHCPADAIPPCRIRPHAPADFLIGLSCHGVAEVEGAVDADFCVFGPVFATPSKLAYGSPLGLEALGAATQCGRPVLALGGIDAGNAAQCLAQGAVGLAGIRMFATGNMVRDLHVLLQRGPQPS